MLLCPSQRKSLKALNLRWYSAVSGFVLRTVVGWLNLWTTLYAHDDPVFVLFLFLTSIFFSVVSLFSWCSSDIHPQYSSKDSSFIYLFIFFFHRVTEFHDLMLIPSEALDLLFIVSFFNVVLFSRCWVCDSFNNTPGRSWWSCYCVFLISDLAFFVIVVVVASLWPIFWSTLLSHHHYFPKALVDDSCVFNGVFLWFWWWIGKILTLTHLIA